MNYAGRAIHSPPEGAIVPHIFNFDLQQRTEAVAQPLEVAFHTGAAEIIENQNRLSFGKETCRDVGSDEASAACDQNGLGGVGKNSPAEGGSVLQALLHIDSPLAVNSASASAKLSSATRPSIHPASSRKPSEKLTCGAYSSFSDASVISAKQ